MAGAVLDVLLNRKPDRRPVWLMRQAGRYLPEYRAVRDKAGSFLNLCYAPDLAAEVTLQPLRRFDFDAAILFSDILVVPHAMGLSLKFVENEGPRLQTVVDLESVKALKTSGGFAQFDAVAQTVAKVKVMLDKRHTLIGFCGAPWTVASYMIEGGSSNRAKALAVAHERPLWFAELLQKLVDISIQYLNLQIEAGAEAIQIFDSWAGDLPVVSRRDLVVEPIKKIVDGVRDKYPRFPVIVFARGFGEGHAGVAIGTGANAVSLEQDADAGLLLRKLPNGVAVQGNLDPGLLTGDVGKMDAAVRRLLAGVSMDRHIFNLGHGITPDVAPDRVQHLVDLIRMHDGSVA